MWKKFCSTQSQIFKLFLCFVFQALFIYNLISYIKMFFEKYKKVIKKSQKGSLRCLNMYFLIWLKIRSSLYTKNNNFYGLFYNK